MQIRAMRNSDQRGDTIVEVLIAIVVVSMVLVAAYTTTTHNVNSMQDTEEHSEALQLAQTQLEYLHNADSKQQPANGDCYVNNETPVGGSNCFVDSGGSTTPAGTQPGFTLSITKVNASTSKIAVTWTGLDQAVSKDNVTLYYQP